LFLYALRRIFTGHDFEFVRSGNAALERIESGVRYDVILLDLTMPQMSGMRVYAELMRIDPAQAARVIFITGGVLTSDAQRFLDEVAEPPAAQTLRCRRASRDGAQAAHRLDQDPRSRSGGPFLGQVGAEKPGHVRDGVIAPSW